MKHVSIEIIQKCSNECIHCSSMANRNCDTFIKYEKLKEIIDGLSNLKTELISISGGEPFLHSHLVEIVEYAVSKNIRVDIYTSGIVFDDKNAHSSLNNDVLKKLREVGVNKLIFNVQSLRNNVYDKIMQTEGNLPKLLYSLRKSKENKIFTEIHFVPMKVNIDEIDDIVNFVNEKNIDRVSFLGLIPHGRAELNEKILCLDNNLSNNLKVKLKSKLKEIANEKIRIGIPLQTEEVSHSCNAGKEKLYIKFDGKVYGCEAFKYFKLYDLDKREVIPDSVHDKKIEDIFYSSKYLRLEDKFIKSQRAKILNSEKCPVQKYLRCESKAGVKGKNVTVN